MGDKQMKGKSMYGSDPGRLLDIERKGSNVISSLYGSEATNNGSRRNRSRSSSHRSRSNHGLSKADWIVYQKQTKNLKTEKMEKERSGSASSGSVLSSKRRGTMPEFRRIARLGLIRNTSQESFSSLLRDVRFRRSHSVEDAARLGLGAGGARAVRGSLSLASDSFGSELPRLVDRETLQLKWKCAVQLVLALTKLYTRAKHSIWQTARFAEQMKTVGLPAPGDSSDDQFLLFDPSNFKARRQMRMTPEVKRILTQDPEERTEQGVYYAMIALRGIQQIADYPVRMQNNLANYGRFESYEAGRVIVKQDRTPEAFYFILYGSVLVAVTEGDPPQANTKCFLNRGDSFGELAIMHRYERQSTVISKSYVELLSIDVQTYEKIFMVGGTRNIHDPDHHAFIKNLLFLRGWPLHLLDEHQDKIISCYFKRGSVMVKDSNCCDWIYIVKSGSVQVLKKLRQVSPTVSSRTGRELPTRPGQHRRHRHWMQRSVPPTSPHFNMADSDQEVEDGEDGEEEGEGSTWQLSAVKRIQSAVSRLSRDQRGVLRTGHATSPRGGATVRPTQSAVVPTASRRRAKIAANRRHHLKTAPAETSGLTGLQGEDSRPIEKKPTFRDGRRTFVDDLNSGYNDIDHVITEADIHPVFVIVQTLTKGSVFGLSSTVFRDQPSLYLVSNGAECIMINKSFYQQHCPKRLMQKLKTQMSPYPTEEHLQDNLLTRVNWDNFKVATLHQVMRDRRKTVTSY